MVQLLVGARFHVLGARLFIPSARCLKTGVLFISHIAVESSLLKSSIFDENSRNENAFFSMFSTSMT